MNLYQNHKKNMILAVLGFFLEYPDKLSDNLILSDGVDRLRALDGEIDLRAVIQMQNTTGVTLDKKGVRNLLIDETLRLSAATFAINDPTVSAVLRTQAGITPSKLRKMGGNRLASFTDAFFKLAYNHSSHLADVNYSSDLLDNYEYAVSEWHSMIGKPRTAISRRSAATAEMADLFSKVSAHFTQRLDRCMAPYRSSDPDFFFNYVSARKILGKSGSGKKKEDKTV